MNRANRDRPGDRELERQQRQARAKPVWQPGTFTGHEAAVGSTAQATKRNKRSR